QLIRSLTHTHTHTHTCPVASSAVCSQWGATRGSGTRRRHDNQSAMRGEKRDREMERERERERRGEKRERWREKRERRGREQDEETEGWRIATGNAMYSSL